MIERVALAIDRERAAQTRYPAEVVCQTGQPSEAALAIAREAIKAMREPTIGQLLAGAHPLSRPSAVAGVRS